MPWTVRAVDLAEAAPLAAFAAALFRQAYGATHPEPVLSEYLAKAFSVTRTAQTIADPASTVLVIESVDGAWAGYAELHEGAPVAPGTKLDVPLLGTAPLEIVRFYVDRQWHGRGVAHALMESCDVVARERGCDVLWLQAWQEAAQAVRFYRKVGFGIHGTAVFMFGKRADADFILVRAVANAPSPQTAGGRTQPPFDTLIP
jgi:ribosomal protein S18 acetylase RimI-like enzyme